MIERYPWPGNVRQLINAIDRAKILADDEVLRVRDLPHEIFQPRPAVNSAPRRPPDDLSCLERIKIVEVLKRERGNKTHAANALGIERRKLYRLMERYGIREQDFIEGE